MIILGVDPGTICTGYGIVEYNRNEFTHLNSGIINLSSKLSVARRLDEIYGKLNNLIKVYKPSELSIETAFYGKNVQSAMKIGYARGVSLLAAIHNNINIGEYSPREIKKAVVGNGNASKEQVQYMVFKILALRKRRMVLDESDALAVSICHAFKLNNSVFKVGDWKSFIKANPDKVIKH